MMRVFFVFILACSSVLSYAQKEVLYTDIDIQPDGKFYQRNHQEPFTGTVIDNFFDGTNKLKAQFKDGLPNGKYVEYYQGGQIRTQYSNKAGHKTGKEVQYYEDGSVHLELSYIEGRPNGIVKEYFPNGKLMSNGRFENGVEEGEHTWYYKTGKIKETIPYTDGRATGLAKKYYPSGERKEETNVLEGRENGASTIYAITGEKLMEGEYENGKEVGKHKVWATTGQLLEETIYDAGSIIERKIYRNAELTLKNGFKEVYNQTGAYFTVDITGEDVKPFKYDGTVFLIDNQIIQLLVEPVPASSINKKGMDFLKDYVSLQKKSINEAINYPERPAMSYLFRKPNPLLNDTLDIDLSFSVQEMNSYINWSYKEPDLSSKKDNVYYRQANVPTDKQNSGEELYWQDNDQQERKRLQVRSQHFTTMRCNDYVLTVSSFLTDKHFDAVKMQGVIDRILKTVVIHDGPIELTELSKSILN